VPTIDAAQFLSKDNQETPIPPEVIQQIIKACSEWGFFQLVNHGIPQDVLDTHYEATKRFFAKPLPEKLSCKRSADNSMGYFNDEYTKRKMDIKEGFDFRHVPHQELPDNHPENFDPQGVNRWPEGDQEFRSINEAYFKQMEHISFKLLEVFALGLGQPAKALYPLFDTQHTSFLRLNYYPVTPDAEPGSLGISDHKDAGFLTVLVQDDVPGLQVLREGVWHLVKPQRGALTINVGDMAQVLTNDVFVASNHRVLRSTAHDRYSRAFFFNPVYSADIQPLPSLAASGGPHYKPINWKEFRLKRFEGDYADVGEEVQIDWYRLGNQGAVH